MEPYIAGYASVPKSLLKPAQIAKLKKMATVTPRAFGGEVRVPISGWRETDNYLHLPIVRGLYEVRKMIGLEHAFKDRTSLGKEIVVPRFPDPNHPEASEGQGEFMQKLLSALKKNYAVLGVAGTGNGKTASALWVAGILGRTTLVVVPGENLAHNWKDEIKKHLGLKDEEIGWVQQNKCDYLGKKVVIAVVHSLCRRAYPPSFYSYFGMVIYDEVHSMAARTFCRTLGKIPARYKLALSATPDRKDGCQNLFLNYFGTNFVEADDDSPMDCTAFVVDYKLPFEDLPDNDAILLNIITKLKSRNRLITNWISKLYQKNRTILVVSDRIEQLCTLRDAMAAQYNVPMERMCIYAKQNIVNGERIRVTVKELQELKKCLSIRVYFATYGVFKQGENIPRLDAGIEATPRGDGRQAPGRIRRRRKNKAKPIWISIRDHGSYKLTRRAKSRINEFEQAKIKVVYANQSSQSKAT